jgi:hypothetical protein
MRLTSSRIAAIVAAAFLTATVLPAQEVGLSSLTEAPLEDVWPALSEPRLGDLDEMVARGEIRVLTTFTLGSYFIFLRSTPARISGPRHDVLRSP